MVVDYVTTTTITVSAEDEFKAADAVYAYLGTQDGQQDMLRRWAVCRNVPDGADVADVSEGSSRVPTIYQAELERKGLM